MSDLHSLPEHTRKLINNPGALCNMIKRVAIEAGAITLKYFDGIEDMGAERKGDNSPVTLADREAEDYIEKELAKIAPGIPMIGEEGVSCGKAPDVKGAEFFWLVDPLDGTREFISGGQDFTVNIGLIHNGVPILGVVYAPARGEMYAGHGPGTAVRWLEDSDLEKPVEVRDCPAEGLTVVASKSHGDPSRLEKFLENFKIAKLAKYGSSLKICVIAGGKADLYPRFGPTCEWDTAAADAVVRAAGGYLTDTEGKPLHYGGADPKWLNPEFIVSSFVWWEEAA